MAASSIHISLSAEPVFYVGEFAITNSMFTSLLVSATLILFAVLVRVTLKKTNQPTGLQNFAEWIVESLYGLVYSVTNNHKKSAQFLPFIATFFLFILLNNWGGLLPGVGSITVKPQTHAEISAPSIVTPVYAVTPAADSHAPAATEEHAASPTESTAHEAEQTDSEHSSSEAESHMPAPLFRPGTADLNTTLALAIISMSMVQVFGISHLGMSYFSKFFNFSSPILFFVGLLEIISEFAKIISFAFRLFGNIFAGEVLLTVISYLAAFAIPMPFYGIEIFVGFIQALVFAMLSVVFFDMATHSHSDH